MENALRYATEGREANDTGFRSVGLLDVLPFRDYGADVGTGFSAGDV